MTIDLVVVGLVVSAVAAVVLGALLWWREAAYAAMRDEVAMQNALADAAVASDSDSDSDDEPAPSAPLSPPRRRAPSITVVPPTHPPGRLAGVARAFIDAAREMAAVLEHHDVLVDVDDHLAWEVAQDVLVNVFARTIDIGLTIVPRGGILVDLSPEGTSLIVTFRGTEVLTPTALRERLESRPEVAQAVGGPPVGLPKGPRGGDGHLGRWLPRGPAVHPRWVQLSHHSRLPRGGRGHQQ